MARTTTLTMTEPSSSATSNYELHSLPRKPDSVFTPTSGFDSDSKQGPLEISNQQPPSNAVEALQRWNSPSINMWRVFATFWSFFVVGMNDGSYGSLVPFLEKYYDLTYTVVSLVFLSPFVGYTLAAFTNNLMHMKFGQRGVAIVGPLCHLVSFTVMAIHPPYPVLIIMFAFVGFGNGLIDAAWCAWIGNMANANEVSGVLQACYALGATVAPLISTTMFTKGGLEWYSFYYIMAAFAALELATSASTFWKQTSEIFMTENPEDPNAKTGRTRSALKNKVTWVFAIFIFGYMGAEISLGGWIVKFMTTVRSAPSFESGMTATGFWAGMTVGRLVLPFFTSYVGEFRSVLIYLFLSLCFELLFWLVPSFVVSAIAVAFLGFFFGPLFPTAIVLVTKLLPRRLHVGTIGFGTAVGGSGGAVFPFLVGVIAQNKGVKSLQPVILALLAAISVCWLLLPGAAGEKKDEESGSRDELASSE